MVVNNNVSYVPMSGEVKTDAGFPGVPARRVHTLGRVLAREERATRENQVQGVATRGSMVINNNESYVQTRGQVKTRRQMDGNSGRKQYFCVREIFVMPVFRNSSADVGNMSVTLCQDCAKRHISDEYLNFSRVFSRHSIVTKTELKRRSYRKRCSLCQDPLLHVIPASACAHCVQGIRLLRKYISRPYLSRQDLRLVEGSLPRSIQGCAFHHCGYLAEVRRKHQSIDR